MYMYMTWSIMLKKKTFFKHGLDSQMLGLTVSYNEKMPLTNVQNSCSKNNCVDFDQLQFWELHLRPSSVFQLLLIWILTAQELDLWHSILLCVTDAHAPAIM